LVCKAGLRADIIFKVLPPRKITKRISASTLTRLKSVVFFRTMTTSLWTLLSPCSHQDQDTEMRPIPILDSYGGEDISHSSSPARTQQIGERQRVNTKHYSSLTPLIREPSLPPLPTDAIGVPTAKKRLYIKDLLAAALSLVCFALSFTAVANNEVSWRLGKGTNQLIVLGFLLSVMNLCLSSVAPTLFLLLEARFGSSTLQNYDGILRNQVLASKLGTVWRLVLGTMLALPIGLSVAYKRFGGGESSKVVNPTAYTGNTSYYGMFAPPGLQLLGERTGISLFANSTLPFLVATSSTDDTGAEPPLPSQEQSYGYNILLLNNESAAILDIPQPDYVSSVQESLAIGESWRLTAPVIGTVATFNNSKTTNPDFYNSSLIQLCENTRAGVSSGAYNYAVMLNHYSLVLMNHPAEDQSFQYIGFPPDPGVPDGPTCANYSYYAQLYDIKRQTCKGTWTITRGGIQLLEGSCDNIILPYPKQVIITDISFFVGYFYMPSLIEFLGPFATTRNQSVWNRPYMATGIAAMLWSRITVVEGAANLAETNAAPFWVAGNSSATNLTFEDVGLIYPINDKVVYTRPTLQKSPWLYLVLGTQPLLLLAIILLSAMFYSTPLSNGFGMISILSGIDRGSLDSLGGAALSGELATSIKLAIQTSQKDDTGSIGYQIMSSKNLVRKGKLERSVVYH
jgi:hypothetical protein